MRLNNKCYHKMAYTSNGPFGVTPSSQQIGIDQSVPQGISYDKPNRDLYQSVYWMRSNKILIHKVYQVIKRRKSIIIINNIKTIHVIQLYHVQLGKGNACRWSGRWE